MNVIFENEKVIIKNQPHLSLDLTFDCGQCFRFNKNADGMWQGVAFGKTLVGYTQGADTVLFCKKEDYLSVWEEFFDLKRDYSVIQSSFSHDQNVSHAAEIGKGIRILKQDKWETLVSFIISQNNNIPRIKKIIESLCQTLGEPLGNGVYSFPTAQKIREAGAEGLAPIKAGFRVKYILDAAHRVLNGETDLEYIASLSYEEAENELMKIKGVGKKVASCVLLFGYGFLSAFPVDVWVKRVIEKYYDETFDPLSLGEYAGIAQQYLFYRERYLLSAEN
ncbi:MAG: DNA-3-methyladenine glycosylase 2 family protein [Clostridia bacterium]|nr:DNA-3-methyladenine glycosylase 2 family protein [Clostridia bacterium]